MNRRTLGDTCRPGRACVDCFVTRLRPPSAPGPHPQDPVAANLKVLHNQEAFEEGTEHILHLKDVSVLDEKGQGLNMADDALENAALLDDERRRFKHKSKKSV